MVLLSVIIALFTLYGLLILYYQYYWNAIPVHTLPASPAATRISVIIPARNEEKNIGQLLAALQEQVYPKKCVEIIVVDDHSEDGTATIVKNFPGVILISLQQDQINSYKKKAIETGIAAAKSELIVTTDADCLPTPYWLQSIASFKEKNQPVFIAAPVSISNGNGNRLLSVFQQLDFMVLQGITGASVYKNFHSMCNGANLAYEKNVFTEVNGFSGIDTIASGDDMLLMHKIWKQYPQRVQYLKTKEAIVSTAPAETWSAFFTQRIRWASKATTYDDKRIMAVLLLVYLFNLSFLALLIAGFVCHYYWYWLGGLWIAKTIIEFPFVYAIAGFFGKRNLLKYFFFFQPLHIIYTIASGLFGQFGNYEWKGRKVH